jgi:hypothetical protein
VPNQWLPTKCFADRCQRRRLHTLSLGGRQRS